MAHEHLGISIEALNFVWGMLSYTRSNTMKANTSKLRVLAYFMIQACLL